MSDQFPPPGHANERPPVEPTYPPPAEPQSAPGEPMYPPPGGPQSAPAMRGAFADGEWHRLHPATPLLRGGVALVAVFAIVISNLREQLINFFIPQPSYCGDDEPFCGPDDPVTGLIESGNLIFALLALALILLVAIAGFWLSWRMHAFRISDERLEVKSGILFRTHRQGRLDRIQGINITRPLIARIFGAARLEITVAGDDANIQLAYLSGTRADELRAEVLRLASGARQAKAPVAAAAPVASGVAGVDGVIERRIQELTAPELDPNLAPPESVVHMNPGRLVASTLLSGVIGFIIIPAIFIVPFLLIVNLVGDGWEVAVPVILGSCLPLIVGGVSYNVSKLVKSLRFTIAGTPDGIRVGYGLLSTSNETLPPGRIHSVSISQPLLWRPFDWWEVKVNRAGTSSAQGAAGQKNTTILPVGTREDAYRVIELVIPALERPDMRELVIGGLASASSGDGYTTSPKRGAVLRWFSWRRNGFALAPEAVFLRRGAIWRELVILPTARMQSVALRQGPLMRLLRLALVHPHTVAGPVSTQLGALDVRDAEVFLREASMIGVEAARADRTQRWGEAPAATTPAEAAPTMPRVEAAPASGPTFPPPSVPPLAGISTAPPAVPPASPPVIPTAPSAVPAAPNVPPAFPPAPPAVPPAPRVAAPPDVPPASAPPVVPPVAWPPAVPPAAEPPAAAPSQDPQP